MSVSCADGDEPILSGTGRVSKDCSVGELESWAEVLARWTDTSQRPRQLNVLVCRGVPEALRGEVWQRLAQCDNDNAIMDVYRLLITKVLASTRVPSCCCCQAPVLRKQSFL